MSGYDFTVDKADLHNTHLRTVQPGEVAPGEVVLQIERFALTTNNITYGVAADLLGYWQFFPAVDGEGHIPVWGIASVTESANDAIAVGSRFYGYYPMASHHTMAPEATSTGFIETAAHRQKLPPLYNRYTAATPAAGFGDDYDSHQAIYRILFETGFVLDNYLYNNQFFGAEQVILSSASSKTSISAAFSMERRGVDVVGLTSEKNRGFVEGLDLYDEVITYDEIEGLDPAIPTAYADMSGNGSVLASVHNQFRDNLVSSYGLGITHRDARGDIDRSKLPGAAPGMFFAPTNIQGLIDDLGHNGYLEMMTPVWGEFLEEVDDWISIKEFDAPDGVETAYRSVLDGASPDTGFVVVNP